MSEITTSDEIMSNPPTGDLQHIQAGYRLNGKNYLKWSQYVRTYLKGKGKLSHLLGEGPTYEPWKSTPRNETISFKLSLHVLDLPSTSQTWKSVKA